MLGSSRIALRTAVKNKRGEMFQTPTRLPNPNPKLNLRLFIKASRAMGGKGKQPVNNPGQGGQEAHLRETLSRFSERRFGSSISLRFPPLPRGCNRGTRGGGDRKPGKQTAQAETGQDRGAGERAWPGAAAVVRGAEKPGTSRAAAAATCLSRSAGGGSGCAPAKPVLTRGLEVPAGEVPTADP